MPKRMKNLCPYKNVHTNVRSSVIHNSKRKQPKCPSTDEWINKMGYLHIMECYSVIKRNELAMRAMRQMNPENTCSENGTRHKRSNMCYDSIDGKWPEETSTQEQID